MKKRVVAERRSDCPLNATLEVLGDRWSLLIVRDLMFKGRTTYKDFLAGGEGIATNVLANRLQRLEAEGVIGKGRDAADARRLVYRLTTNGLALAPLLVQMIDPPPRVDRKSTPLNSSHVRITYAVSFLT